MTRRLRRELGLAVLWGALLLRVATEGFQRASGKPFGAPAGAYPLPRRGLTRRLRRGLGLAVPWGTLLFRVANRRGCRGASGKPPCLHDKKQLCRKKFPLAGIDAPTPAREKGLQPSWGTHLLRRRSEEGAGGRAESHPASMTRDSFAVRNSPLRGPAAPTPARIGTCRPKEHSHFSFGGERKVCKRKPAARRLREKALYCPFLKEGVRNVARSMVERSTWTFVRARAHSFPLSKRARLFPSAAYRRSAPPQLARGRLIPCGVGCFGVAWRFCSVRS